MKETLLMVFVMMISEMIVCLASMMTEVAPSWPGPVSGVYWPVSSVSDTIIGHNHRSRSWHGIMVSSGNIGWTLSARGKCCGRITHLLTTIINQSQPAMLSHDQQLTNHSSALMFSTNGKWGLYPRNLTKAPGERSCGRPIGEFVAWGKDNS